MYCTNCGQKLTDESVFCTACGTKQATREDARQSIQNQAVRMRQIIGKNADYYMSAFQQIRYAGRCKINWASFFFNLWHASYRNVWREWLKTMKWVLVGIVGSWILGSILFYTQFIAGIVVCSLGSSLILVLGIKEILFAKRFNGIYKQHIEEKIMRGDYSPDPSGSRVVLAYLIAFAVYVGIGSFLAVNLIGGAALAFAKSTPEEIQEVFASAFEEEKIVDTPIPQTAEEVPVTVADLSNYIGDWTNTQSGKPHFTISRTADGSYEIDGYVLRQEGAITVSIDPTPLFVSGTTATAQYAADNWGGAGTITLELDEDGFYATVTAKGGAWSMEMDRQWFTRDDMPEETTPVVPVEETLETLYSDYLNGFLDAVNTGDFSKVAYTMKPGSTIYTQQEVLVASLFSRGIREEAMACSIQDRYLTSETQAEIIAEEGIQVFYPDGTAKLITQTYTYLAEKDQSGNWLLVDMIEQQTSSTDITSQ